MKKWLIGSAVLLIILAAVPAFVLPMLGMSSSDLKANIDVGGAMSAKLACSARYISGFDEARAKADVVSYSPAFEWVNISYDDKLRRAEASLLGMGSAAAQFRPGLGCTLARGNSQILDNLKIPDLAPTQGLWPRGDETGRVNPFIQEKLDALLAQDNAAGLQTRALVVVQGDQLVAESYAGTITGQTPLLGWSMGKSITAIMAGRLEMQGLLDISQNNLFPAWEGDERRAITVEHLLQMNSGLAFSEVYAPGSDATNMLFLAPSAADVALQSLLAYPPGSHFSYSSGTSNLLMHLMTDLLGGPQAALDFLWQQIFAPAGIRRAVFAPDPSGVMVASSYIYASPRDWARLGLVMLKEGEINGARLFSTDWAQRAQTKNNSSNGPAYGYQIWLNDGGEQLRWPDLPGDAYAMTGNRQQLVMILPSQNMVLVRLGWTAGRYPASSNFAELIAAAKQADEEMF